MDTEPTIGDVLKEVRAQGSKTDQRFDTAKTASDARFDTVLGEIRAQGSKTDQRFEDVMKEARAQESRTEQRFDDVLEAVNKGFTGVQTQIEGLKTDVTGLTQRVTHIEAVMVTKDYLDEKLARTDGKINALVNVLEKKAVITTEDKSAVLA